MEFTEHPLLDMEVISARAGRAGWDCVVNPNAITES